MNDNPFNLSIRNLSSLEGLVISKAPGLKRSCTNEDEDKSLDRVLISPEDPNIQHNFFVLNQQRPCELVGLSALENLRVLTVFHNINLSGALDLTSLPNLEKVSISENPRLNVILFGKDALKLKHIKINYNAVLDQVILPTQHALHAVIINKNQNLYEIVNMEFIRDVFFTNIQGNLAADINLIRRPPKAIKET